MKLKIKKGDNVMVITGNNKGDIGRVLEVIPDKMRILVEGVNIRKRSTRPNQQNQKGGIVSKELPIHYSNVMLVDSEKRPTRINTKIEEREGKKVTVRYAVTNEKEL